MIRVGLASFKEHNRLTGKKNNTLYEYAGSLPSVELNTAYCGILRKSSAENWTNEVPESFRFVAKVYQGTSGQGDWKPYYQTEEEMVTHSLGVMPPMVEAGKLFYFLIQLPSSLKCIKENVQYLCKPRKRFEGYPVAVELRDYSRYSDEFLERMRNFISRAALSLTIADEPQLSNTTIPFDPFITDSNLTLSQFHGRNAQGWQADGKGWRKKRTLHRYSEEELQELACEAEAVDPKTKEIDIIFNNSPGRDVAENALVLQKILDIQPDGFNPTQMDLF